MLLILITLKKLILNSVIRQKFEETVQNKVFLIERVVASSIFRLVQTEEILSKNWHSSLNLVFARSYDTTVLIQNRVQAPLKVRQPFYPEGPVVCHSVVLHTGGGVVGGDRLSLNFHLLPNAIALITTVSAGKVYRSNGLQAKQSIQIQVDANACLELLPQETIVFNGAIYR